MGTPIWKFDVIDDKGQHCDLLNLRQRAANHSRVPVQAADAGEGDILSMAQDIMGLKGLAGAYRIALVSAVAMLWKKHKPHKFLVIGKTTPDFLAELSAILASFHEDSRLYVVENGATKPESDAANIIRWQMAYASLLLPRQEFTLAMLFDAAEAFLPPEVLAKALLALKPYGQILLSTERAQLQAAFRRLLPQGVTIPLGGSLYLLTAEPTDSEWQTAYAGTEEYRLAAAKENAYQKMQAINKALGEMTAAEMPKLIAQIRSLEQAINRLGPYLNSLDIKIAANELKTAAINYQLGEGNLDMVREKSRRVLREMVRCQDFAADGKKPSVGGVRVASLIDAAKEDFFVKSLREILK